MRHGEPSGQLGGALGVDLGERGGAGQVLCGGGELGRHRAARAAPGRPEVDHDRQGGLLDDVAEQTEVAAVERDPAPAGEGMRLARMDTPVIAIDGFVLDMEGSRCLAVVGARSVLRGSTAEGFMPGHVLARHHVIFDYPEGRFTMARPGALEPRGEPVDSPIHPESGLVPRLGFRQRNGVGSATIPG